MACGAPVIAFGRGGATETVRAGQTGLFFEDQTTDSLIEAMETFERTADRFDPAAARRQAERFTGRRFEDELFGFLDETARPHTTAARRAA